MSERVEQKAVESEAARRARHLHDLQLGQSAARVAIGQASRTLNHLIRSVPNPERPGETVQQVLSPSALSYLTEAFSRGFAILERSIRLELDVGGPARDPLVELWSAADEVWRQRFALRGQARDRALPPGERAAAHAAAEGKRKEGKTQDDTPAAPRRGNPPPTLEHLERPRHRRGQPPPERDPRQGF